MESKRFAVRRAAALCGGLLLALQGAARADDPGDVAAAAAAVAAVSSSAGQDPLAARPELVGAELSWPPSFAVGGGWSAQPIPRGDLYPRYVADPRRPRFSVQMMRLFDTEVEGGGDGRVAVNLGGRYNFLRLHPDGDPDRGFQLDIEAGFHGQFDAGSSLDSVGWEGYYGLGLSWRPTESLALRLAMNHDSSHIGDEYQENNEERERINYTREELALGISWSPVERLRLYGEVGWAYHRGNNQLLDRARLQAGIEYETAPILWGDGALYVGLDAVLWQEDGWEPSVTVQTGVKWHIEALERDYRLGLQFYDGRSQIGEFFQDRERYLAFGFWFDL